MTRQAARTRFETVAAEWPKFTAPLLLVSGLWCGPTAWRRSMGYFAHRGWTCHAVDPAGAARPASVAQWRELVQDAVQQCAAPPVLVGHDLGGWLVLQDPLIQVRAVVALAPLVPRVLERRGHPAMTGWAAWWALRRLAAVPAPSGTLAERCFAGGVPGGNVSEPVTLLRELARLPATSTLAHVPTLVVAGERDAVCPPDEVATFARSLGAEFRVAPAAGHALPWEPGWEGRVHTVHRWLVQTLGEPLLAALEDEDE